MFNDYRNHVKSRYNLRNENKWRYFYYLEICAGFLIEPADKNIWNKIRDQVSFSQKWSSNPEKTFKIIIAQRIARLSVHTEKRPHSAEETFARAARLASDPIHFILWTCALTRLAYNDVVTLIWRVNVETLFTNPDFWFIFHVFPVGKVFLTCTVTFFSRLFSAERMAAPRLPRGSLIVSSRANDDRSIDQLND